MKNVLFDEEKTSFSCYILLPFEVLCVILNVTKCMATMVISDLELVRHPPSGKPSIKKSHVSMDTFRTGGAQPHSIAFRGVFS